MARMNARHKFNAKPTVVDNIRFASQKEARRYQELKLLERAGEVKDIEIQPEFRLTVVGGFVKDVIKEIGCYRADFTYWDKARGRVVEDVKGFKTPLYRWKKKHVEAQYGITIREV